MILPEDVAQALEDLKPYFKVVEEVQLCDYGESANSGPWVKFRLLAPESLEPYRGQDRSGRNARTGKRYTLMLVELNDQDEHVSNVDKPKKLSQIAGAVCHDPQFRKWCELEYREPVPDEEAAANLIREVCGIESRSMLDANKDAAEVFRKLLSDYDSTKHG